MPLNIILVSHFVFFMIIITYICISSVMHSFSSICLHVFYMIIITHILCIIVNLGSHSVLAYRSEYDTVGTSVKAAIVYLGTALVKVCEHNFCVVVLLMLQKRVILFHYFGEIIVSMNLLYTFQFILVFLVDLIVHIFFEWEQINPVNFQAEQYSLLFKTLILTICIISSNRDNVETMNKHTSLALRRISLLLFALLFLFFLFEKIAVDLFIFLFLQETLHSGTIALFCQNFLF